MQSTHLIQTIDTHTMGEPTRIIIGGIPRIIGKTMMQKKNYLIKEMDWLRKMLMQEPRGHGDMFGAIITDPVNDDSEFGILFMDSGGYLNMCGHGTIATLTVAAKLNLIPKKKFIKIDTPVGIIECHMDYEDGDVKSVSFVNVPAFVFEKDVSIQVEGYGTVQLDIVFGGSIFGIVDAKQFDLQLVPVETNKIIQIGKKILKAANEQLSFSHPIDYEINSVDLIELSIKKSETLYRNTVIFGEGQIDRSPCGTGTCAKMALLHSKGELAIKENFYHESIINSIFEGKLVRKVKVAEYDAVIPIITGSAWITGTHQFILEKEDPYKEGFLLK